MDIGANIGDTAIFFACNGAKRIIGVEPFHKNFEIAEKNINANKLTDTIQLIKENIRLLNTIQDGFMSFEKIDIPIGLGILKTKITIDRSKYKIIKHAIEKCIGNFFGLRKNDKKKIVLLEFNPEVYHDLLKEINRRGFQPVLINFRKSAIFNFRTLRYLMKSKSAIMIPQDWLEKVELEEFEKIK